MLPSIFGRPRVHPMPGWSAWPCSTASNTSRLGGKFQVTIHSFSIIIFCFFFFFHKAIHFFGRQPLGVSVAESVLFMGRFFLLHATEYQSHLQQQISPTKPIPRHWPGCNRASRNQLLLPLSCVSPSDLQGLTPGTDAPRNEVLSRCPSLPKSSKGDQ